jgi:hypothetical protein
MGSSTQQPGTADAGGISTTGASDIGQTSATDTAARDAMSDLSGSNAGAATGGSYEQAGERG